MKKKFLLVITFFILLSLVSCTKTGDRVCYNKKCFYVEVADTPEERSQGLMGREELGKNKGMLFIFEKEGIYPFWMKDTLMPVDIIWIDDNYKVIYVNRNTPPCGEGFCASLQPSKEARYVLEINGGISRKIGLSEGSQLTFHLEQS